jgi:hypothetical protein
MSGSVGYSPWVVGSFLRGKKTPTQKELWNTKILNRICGGCRSETLMVTVNEVLQAYELP